MEDPHPHHLHEIYAGKVFEQRRQGSLRHVEGIGAICVFCTHTSQSSGKGDRRQIFFLFAVTAGSKNGIEKTKRIGKTTSLHTNHEKNVTLRAEAPVPVSNLKPRSGGTRTDQIVPQSLRLCSRFELSSWRSILTRRDPHSQAYGHSLWRCDATGYSAAASTKNVTLACPAQL